MFGSIKKIFSGIVSFLVGFFNNKKSLEGKPNKPRKRNGYFLELEETDVPKELKAVAQSVASATKDVKAKASELVSNKTDKTDKEPVAAKAAPAKAEAKKAEAAPAKAEAKKAEAAPAKAEAAKAEPAPTTQQPPKVEVELVQTAEGVEAKAVKPAKKPAKAIADSNGKAASTTFAPEYLMPSASSRRRPGANMSSFLDMARQVKAPG